MPNESPPADLLRVAATALPVLAEADVAVAGGGFGGLALALELARQGRSVCVLESRIAPGWEVSALLRPWLADPGGEPVPALLAPWLEGATRPAGAGELALIPDMMKRGLEDAVLAAGVRLEYACLPVGLVHADGRIAGVVVGTKSGRRVVLARAVVDAGDAAVLGRLVGAFHPRAAGSARRTLEFTRVDAGVDAASAGPACPPGVRPVAVHAGHAGPGHVLLELEFAADAAAPAATLAGRMAAEVAARRASFVVAERLVHGTPGWARARLAHASWELWRTAPWAVEGPLPAGLHLLSGALAAGADAAAWLDPVAAARWGAAAAATVGAAASAAPRPQAAACEARCAREAGAGPAAVTRDACALDEGPRVQARAEALPVLARPRILVAGGGTSGAPTAAVAAGTGERTLVLEMNWGLGGTGTVGGVDSYWFGRRVGVTVEVDRKVKDVSAALGIPVGAQWNVEAKMHALLEYAVDAGAEPVFGSLAAAALLEGTRVTGVLAATPDGLYAVPAEVAIDGSGDGDLAAAAGATTWYGSTRDRLPMWYLLAPVTEPGVLQNGFTSAMDVGVPADYTRAVLAGRRLWPGHDHAAYLSPRETRHVRGGVVLGVTDHVLLRRFPDTINLCFSNCDIKGRSAADWVGWGVLPPNAELEIPYRAVVPEGVDGLLIAGKAYSCTHDFLATARMQADMQNQGGAIALAAVQAVRRGVPPRQVDVPALQRELVARGIIPAAVTGRRADAPGEGPEGVRALLAGLTGDEPFHLEQGFEDRATEPLAVVRLCTAEGAAVPLLVEAWAGAAGRRRLLLARILAWHGRHEGVPDLVAAILAELAGGTLAPIRWKYRYAGTPPDNGVMPEPCHLLHALALVPDERMVPALDRIAELFNPAVDEFRPKGGGLFYYADEAAVAAERWGDPRAIPALRRLASRTAVRGRSIRGLEPDFILDRMAYLEVALARALARCGAADGARTLIGYLGDARELFAVHARAELAAVAGRDLGREPGPWESWLASQGPLLTATPWTARID